MGEREKFILSMCLLYGLDDFDDFVAFVEHRLRKDTPVGDVIQTPTPVEDEIQDLLRTL